MLKEKKVQIEVKIPLTEELAERRGVKLAELERKLRELEQWVKDWTSGRRGEKKELKAKIKEVSEEIETKTQTITVEAVERPIFDTNEIVTARVDTGEIVTRRAMTAEERQVEIDVDADVEPREPAKIVRIDKLDKRKKKQPGAN